MLLSVLKNIKIVKPARRHNLKLINHRCHYDLRKYFFCTRVINTWNSLPESVISAYTTDSFKNKLDKFWSNQYLIYNYKAEVTEIRKQSKAKQSKRSLDEGAGRSLYALQIK